MRRLLAVVVALAAMALFAGEPAGRPDADKTAPAIARGEFGKYCRQICGRVPDGAEFAIDASLDSAHDEYRVSFAGGGVKFTGSNARSLLFAVYDFLSRRCGCRWYWDGDFVPRAEKIDLAGPDIREKSRFEYRAIRYFAHRGLTRFQAEHWGLDDWKREIDWCVKNRINLFMPRIGQDDLFQKAFPETCPYPDASKPCPEAKGLGGGYDDRSLFWPLEFRGRLRKQLLAYAFERGLMVPEDFGTMSHWYSRTPYTFLDKMKPPFLPQQGGAHGHPTDRVWDIRDKRWLDAYWKLTQASIDNYGKPDLLHTIGIAERYCYTNRADNLRMKVDSLNTLVENALSHYPSSKILFASWDFYSSWHAEEVPQLLKTLDPEKVLIWDYEADAHDRTNFTEWNIVGRFPYTFGIFLTLEQGLDIRADYSRIIERQKIIAADPMCKGYIFWPESSHTDQLAINYFAANSWNADRTDLNALVDDLSRGRYGDQAEKMASIWKRVIPVSTNCCDTWRDNCGRLSLRLCLNPKLAESASLKAVDPRTLRDVPAILDALAGVRWEGEFVRRDTIDLARTVADRLLLSLMGDPIANSRSIALMMERFCELLALDTDYSLAESRDRLNAVERITYPGFDGTLFGNAVNGYCASHHYEAFRGVYLPWWRNLAALGTALPRWRVEEMRRQPLEKLRPVLPRTPENYARVLKALAAAAREAFARGFADSRRVAEIAASLPAEPHGPGARIDRRELWDRYRDNAEAKAVIALAEKIAAHDVPDSPPVYYWEWYTVDYLREGDSRRWREFFWKLLADMQTLALAECVENRGRFLKRVCQYIDAIPTMVAWTEPAHDREKTTFDGTASNIDLGQSECARALADVIDLLKPVIPRELYDRTLEEIRRRVFRPYLASGGNRAQNNWNCACNGCTVRAAIAVEPDRMTRARILEMSERLAPLYLEGSFTADGYLGEGLDYWNYGFGNFLAWGLEVRRATGGKVDILAHPRARKAMEYAYTFMLEPFRAPAVSDGSARSPSPANLALGRLAWPELTCERAETEPLFSRRLTSTVYRAFDAESIRLHDQPRRRAFTLPARTWFDAAQFYIGRPAPGDKRPRFTFAVKGGNNGDSHNHNDTGEYMIMLDGVEMVSDPGGEEYTKRTFSSRRYDSKILNSYGHAVPSPAGTLQGAGAKFAAKVLETRFGDGEDEVKLDLRGAYECKGLDGLVRRCVYDRANRRAVVEDKASFAEPAAFETALVTFCRVERTEDPRVVHLICDQPAARRIKVEIDTAGQPFTLREERLENPKRREPTRLAVVLEGKVRNASITLKYTAL